MTRALSVILILSGLYFAIRVSRDHKTEDQDAIVSSASGEAFKIMSPIEISQSTELKSGPTFLEAKNKSRAVHTNFLAQQKIPSATPKSPQHIDISDQQKNETKQFLLDQLKLVPAQVTNFYQVLEVFDKKTRTLFGSNLPIATKMPVDPSLLPSIRQIQREKNAAILQMLGPEGYQQYRELLSMQQVRLAQAISHEPSQVQPRIKN